MNRHQRAGMRLTLVLITLTAATALAQELNPQPVKSLPTLADDVAWALFSDTKSARGSNTISA